MQRKWAAYCGMEELTWLTVRSNLRAVLEFAHVNQHVPSQEQDQLDWNIFRKPAVELKRS